MVAADYPFLDVMWSMLVFFGWFLWIWLAITIFADIFRRHDISGLAKTGWMILVIVLPFLGVFLYLITQNKGMTERTLNQTRAAQKQFDDHVRSVASSSGPADEIATAKQLVDSGAITQAEFETIKNRALNPA